MAEAFTFFRSSFLFIYRLLPRMFQSRASVRVPPDAPFQGAAFLVSTAPRMFQSRGPPSCFLATLRLFQSLAVGWPPGCSSPGGRLLAPSPDVPVQGLCPQPPGCSSPGGRACILLFGLLRSAAPRMLQSRGPLSCFLATLRLFQSLAVGWPPGCSSPGGRLLAPSPDVPVQGLCPQPPGCSSPGGRACILLFGLLRSAAPRMLQSRGPLSCFLATQRPGCSSPGPLCLTMWSCLLRSAVPRLLQSRGRFFLPSRGSGRTQ